MWFFQRRACRSTDRHGAVAAPYPHALAQPVRQSLLAATCAQVLDKSWKEKTGATSRTLGTSGKRLWLLRSRPDPVNRAAMRGGPSRIFQHRASRKVKYV